MRTVQEIKNRLVEIADSDFFGFASSDLIAHLPYEDAKQYLKPEVTADDWKPTPTDYETVLKLLTDYMDFAWDKANNCRGISAGRSMNHMAAWLWLLGEHQAADQLADYTMYGKPQLRAICEKYGINWRLYDDGVWRNDESDSNPPQGAAILTWK